MPPSGRYYKIKDIYFLSFEHSELEGKYSLIVSVYMHACIVSGRQLFVVTAETLGCLFLLHAWTVWLSWWVFKVDALSSSHSLGDSYSQCRAVFPRYVQGCYIISVLLLPHVCFI